MCQVTRSRRVQTNVDEDTLSFNFNITVALVEDNSNVVGNEFTIILIHGSQYINALNINVINKLQHCA